MVAQLDAESFRGDVAMHDRMDTVAAEGFPNSVVAPFADRDISRRCAAEGLAVPLYHAAVCYSPT